MNLVAREAITPTNKSPIFVIVTWILEAATLLAVAVKVLLLQTSIGLQADDWCVIASAIFSIGQVVSASFQGINGVGKVQEHLSSTQLIIYQKSGYASEITYIWTLAASKLAVVVFLYHIAPFGYYRWAAGSLGLFIICWGLASVFATAFQCKNPREWAFVGNHCFNQTAYWTAFGAINIATELALIVLPIEIFLTNIRSWYKRLILTICFSLRLTVVATIAVQIYYLHHPVYPSSKYATSGQAGFTYTSWPIYLTTQIIQSLSIITTCIPFMKSLLTGLETGMIQTGFVSKRTLSISGSRLMDRTTRSNANNTSSLENSRNTGSSRPLIRDRVNSSFSVHSRSRQFSASQPPDETRNSDRSGGRNRNGSLNISWPSDPFTARPSHSHSQREVSMIKEEDELLMGGLDVSDVEAGGGDSGPNQYRLDVLIPAAQMSSLQIVEEGR